MEAKLPRDCDKSVLVGGGSLEVGKGLVMEWGGSCRDIQVMSFSTSSEVETL